MADFKLASVKNREDGRIAKIDENKQNDTTKYIGSKEYQANQDQIEGFLENSIYMEGQYSGYSSDVSQKEDTKEEPETESDETDSSSNEDETQCQICQKIFLDQDDLNLHIRSRRMDDKRYMCCNCRKTFRDNTQLKVHARKHTGEKPFECNICGKKFTVNGNLNKHMRIHTGEKRFECTDCGRKFTQFAHLEDHLKTHSGERPFVCGFCQAAFKTKARLRKHEKSHKDGRTSKRAVSCPTCKIVLKSNRQMATHLVSHVQDTDGPFICHLCGKAFAKYPNLQEHQVNHPEVKSFLCLFCDKAFSNTSHLRRHMNSHSGFRPYSCSVCQRPFPSSQNLKRHMMTHTGEKPYSCPDCEKGFLTLENLNRHRRTHTGEKPFACEICGKLFAHSTTAKEHYRTVHTGEKPFGCSRCTKKFAISKMLYKHIRERHPDYFPQFKKEHNVTPNMKKAQEKFKTKIKCEDDVKSDSSNNKDGTERVHVKEEPMDTENETVKSSHGEEMQDIFKTEPSNNHGHTEFEMKSVSAARYKIEEAPLINPIKKSISSNHDLMQLDKYKSDLVKSEDSDESVNNGKIEETLGSADLDITLKGEDIDIPFVKVETS